MYHSLIPFLQQVTTIPAWVNETHPSVNIRLAVWIAVLTACLIYIPIGWMGGSAFVFSDSVTLLQVLVTSTGHGVLNTVSQVSTYLFPLGVSSSFCLAHVDNVLILVSRAHYFHPGIHNRDAVQPSTWKYMLQKMGYFLVSHRAMADCNTTSNQCMFTHASWPLLHYSTLILSRVPLQQS